MQPIDVRELEARRRLRLLRAAYLGSPIETSSTNRSGDGVRAERTNPRGTHGDPRT